MWLKKAHTPQCPRCVNQSFEPGYGKGYFCTNPPSFPNDTTKQMDPFLAIEYYRYADTAICPNFVDREKAIQEESAKGLFSSQRRNNMWTTRKAQEAVAEQPAQETPTFDEHTYSKTLVDAHAKVEAAVNQAAEPKEREDLAKIQNYLTALINKYLQK